MHSSLVLMQLQWLVPGWSTRRYKRRRGADQAGDRLTGGRQQRAAAPRRWPFVAPARRMSARGGVRVAFRGNLRKVPQRKTAGGLSEARRKTTPHPQAPSPCLLPGWNMHPGPKRRTVGQVRPRQEGGSSSEAVRTSQVIFSLGL